MYYRIVYPCYDVDQNLMCIVSYIRSILVKMSITRFNVYRIVCPCYDVNQDIMCISIVYPCYDVDQDLMRISIVYPCYDFDQDLMCIVSYILVRMSIRI